MREEEESADIMNFHNESNNGEGLDDLRQRRHSRSKSKHRSSKSKLR